METPASNDLLKALSLPLYQSKGWMKLIGVMMILYGVMIALSIVGIIIAWLPIWLGILLFQAASAIEDAQINSNADEFLMAMKRLKTYFTIMGVLTLLGLIMAVIGMFAGIGGAMLGGGHMNLGM